MLVSTTVELPEREEKFVYAIAWGLEPCPAARAAGFAASSASRLLDKPRVLSALLGMENNVHAVLAKLAKRSGEVE